MSADKAGRPFVDIFACELLLLSGEFADGLGEFWRVDAAVDGAVLPYALIPNGDGGPET